MFFDKRVFRHGAVFAGAVIIVFMISGCFFPGAAGSLITPAIRVVDLPDASIVGSVTLTVTGSGMDPIEVSYSQLPSTINIAVPEGTDRQFELTVTTGSSYTGAVASYKGTATADVTSDSTVVTLDMGIGSTKIVVPDEYNNRIVQIDDMSGAGWKSLEGGKMAVFGSLNSNFFPVDVDFDQYGNIFVANNNDTYTGIYRFSSITDSSPVPILKPSTVIGMSAVAIDRTNNRIYGLYGTSVIWSDYAGSLTGGTPFNYIDSNLSTVSGIAVDNDGYVYLCGQDYNSEMIIDKFSMDGGAPVKSYLGAVGTPAMDVTILNGILYATVSYRTSVARIESFDPDTLLHTASPYSYGTYSSAPSAAGEFAGPHNFLATMNNNLTIMDSNADNLLSRIVSVDDITGTGWKIYGAYGSSEGQFIFAEVAY